jgi:propanol-preferring alcohol dehydrogenase
VGGLGHLAVQMGRNLGAEVFAIDVSEQKLEQAKLHGAAHTLNAAAVDVAKEMRRKGGAHAVLVTSAAKAAYDSAFGCIRPTGILLVVGLPAESICFPPISMAGLEVRIQASAVGTREDLREILSLAAEGKIACQVSERPLSEANVVLEQLRRGQVAGRIVLRP